MTSKKEPSTLRLLAALAFLVAAGIVLATVPRWMTPEQAAAFRLFFSAPFMH